MRRWLLLITLSLAAVLTAVAGVAYLTLRDEAFVRAELEQGLREALDRPVVIAGALDLRLKPLPSVSVEGLRIGNASWAHADELLSVDRMELAPSIAALLRGQLVIRSLRLEGARLWLENSVEGEPNWRLPARDEDDASRIRVRSIVATDVELAYFNVDRGVTRRLELDRLEARGERRTGSLEIDFVGEIHELALAGSARVDSLANLSATARTGFSSDLRIGESRLRLTGSVTDPDFRDFSGFEVDLDLAGRRAALLLDWTDLPIPEMRRFALRGRLEGDEGRLTLRDLDGDMEGDGYSVSVAGAADDLVTMAGVDLRLSATGTDLGSLAPALAMPQLGPGPFAVAGRIVGTRPGFALEDLEGHLSRENAELAFEGRVGDLRGGRGLELSAKVAGRQLGQLAAASGLSLPDLDEVEFSGLVSGDWRAPSIRDLAGTVTEGGITARVAGEIGDLAHLADIAVSFDGAGADLADLDAIFGLSFPNTDSLAAAGRVSGSLHGLDVEFERARLTRGDLRLEGGGSMTDLAEVPKVDLDLTLTGKDLRDGAALLGLDAFATREFRIRGRLKGPLRAPDLEAIDGRLANSMATLDVEGRLPDVFGGRRVDLRTLVRGQNLAGLGRQIGRVWPETDTYTLRGHLHGTWARPALDDIDVELSYAAGKLRITGRFGDLLAGRDTELSVQAQADSVTEFLPFGGRLWDRLGAVSGRFDISGGPDDYVMAIDELNAGRTRLSGRFNVGMDEGRLTYVRGRLENSALDVTPWFTDPDEGSAPGAGSARASAAGDRLFSAEPLPVEWMRDLELDVELAGNEIRIGDGVMKVLTGDFVVDEQRMMLDPFGVNYDGAEIAGGFSLASRGTPRLDLRAETSDLDLGSLLRRSGLAPEARGEAGLKLTLKAEGASAGAMAASANGRLSLLMVEGSLGRAEIQLRLSQVIAGLVMRDTKDLSVNCAMLDLPIADGVGRLNVFVLETPDMLMRGEGTVDFRREQFHVLLLPRPKRGRSLAHNANVLIYGSLAHPEQRIDASDTARTVAGAIGRFVLLGPAGLLANPNLFRRAQEECATSLAEVVRDE